MSFDPVAALERFHAAINSLDFETIEKSFAEDATYGSDKVGALRGRDAIMAAFRKYFDEYPDQVGANDLVEQVAPNAARSVWRVEATSSSTGEMMVRKGEETITFEDEGKVVSVVVTDC